MKCMKKASEIVRVTDKEAADKANKGWAYCGKEEWKKSKGNKKSSKKKAEKSESDKPQSEEKPVSKYAKKKQTRDGTTD